MRHSMITGFAIFLLSGTAVNAKSMDPTCFLRIDASVIERSEQVTKENVSELIREAEAGDRRAQSVLALFHAEGKFVPQDLLRAIDWAKRASAKGGTSEKEVLAWLTWMRDVEASANNPQNELAIFRRGAETGLMFMQYMYAETLKAHRHTQESKIWYEKAAAQGCMDARTKLSEMHDWETRGDRVQAYKWIALVDYVNVTRADQHQDLTYDENRVRKSQAQLRRRMTRDEITEGESLAARWARNHNEPYTTRKWSDEHIRYLTESGIVREVENSKGYLLVHFTSFDEGCKPCVQSIPGVDELSSKHRHKIQFARFSREPWWQTNTDVSKKFEVFTLPVMILYKDGKELTRWMGYKTDSLGRLLDLL